MPNQRELQVVGHTLEMHQMALGYSRSDAEGYPLVSHPDLLSPLQ